MAANSKSSKVFSPNCSGHFPSWPRVRNLFSYATWNMDFVFAPNTKLSNCKTRATIPCKTSLPFPHTLAKKESSPPESNSLPFDIRASFYLFEFVKNFENHLLSEPQVPDRIFTNAPWAWRSSLLKQYSELKTSQILMFVALNEGTNIYDGIWPPNQRATRFALILTNHLQKPWVFSRFSVCGSLCIFHTVCAKNTVFCNIFVPLSSKKTNDNNINNNNDDDHNNDNQNNNATCQQGTRKNIRPERL